MDVNLVILVGNLTRDPDCKYTSGGTAYTKFSIAVNRTWKNRDGANQKETDFIDCTAWGKTAETIAQWFKKGRPIYIRGRIKQDRWEDRNTGEKRSKVGVVVEEFQFVPCKDDFKDRSSSRTTPDDNWDKNESTSQQSPTEQQQDFTQDQQEQSTAGTEDDLPF